MSGVIVAARRRMAERLRESAQSVQRAPKRVLYCLQLVHEGIVEALRRLSGRVAGCGCTYDDPEMCGRDWCECPCHGPLPGANT